MQRDTFSKKLLQVATIAFLLVSVGPLRAQVTTGAISGAVTDPAGAAVPGVKVTVTNQATNVSQVLTTDSSGFYSAQGLNVGSYTVDVSQPGFQESITQGILINPGQSRANNVTLAVGATTSKVTVSATAVQVNTQTSELGGTISSQQISNLMLNGRNFQTLAISVPGVSSTAQANALPGGGLEGTTSLIVNGSAVNYTTYTIDGVYNMNSGNLSNINILPIVDGISEFSVLSNNYSARYGLAGAGQIVVETKSGTAAYHGSAWDFLRNNAVDANNYFSTTAEPLHQNIFGFTLGGPVIIPKLFNTDRSKKTYFFTANQWFVISAGQVSRSSVLPQAMRNGNFVASPTLPAGGLTLDAHSQALLATEGKTNCITSPTQVNPACLDPVAVALMSPSLYPLPNNVPGGFLNYINQGATKTSQVDYQDRIDTPINKNNDLMARFLYEQVKNDFPYDNWGGTRYPTITDSYYTTGFNTLVRVASRIRPNLLNTVAVAETYDKPRIANAPGEGLLPKGVSYIQAFPDAPTLGRIPNISISRGWSSMGVSTQPITASDGEGTISDDVSWVKGTHVLQAGALYIFGIKRQNVFTNPQGSFSFTGVHTGDPAADFVLGLNSTYTQASSQKLGSFHYRQGEAYIQDDWRARPNLTLNLGVRWVYFSNDTASGDEVTSFNPNLYNPTQAPVVNLNGTLAVNGSNQPVTTTGQVANLLNGLAFAGKNGVPSGFFIPLKTYFGPRVGFAYDVFGDGTTSIRGGYGIGYSRLPLEAIYNAWGQNPPFNLSANVLNSLLSNGTAGTAAAPTTQTLGNVPFSFHVPQLQSYSLSVQREITHNMVATLAYAGQLGRHLTGTQDINFPLPVSSPSVATGCLAPAQAPSASYEFDPCINTGVASSSFTRPYKGYSGISTPEYDEGSSNYSALESSVNYRHGGSQFSVAYTHSRSLGTVNGFDASAQNPRNFHAEYGPPSYDVPNDITATWVYNIPYFAHASNKAAALALGNWSFAGLFLHQSGAADTPGMSTNTNGEANRPNQVAPFHKIGKLSEWFDTASYAAPAYGFFGDATVGSIRAPGYTSVNVSLYKTFPLVSRFQAQFRAEAFNVLNHPNFGGVSTSLGAGNFGQVTSSGDPRILEFALKLIY